MGEVPALFARFISKTEINNHWLGLAWRTGEWLYILSATFRCSEPLPVTYSLFAEGGNQGLLSLFLFSLLAIGWESVQLAYLISPHWDSFADCLLPSIKEFGFL